MTGNETTSGSDRGFFGHPIGLRVLFLTEFWERFSYYGMRALLILFMVAPADKGGLGFDTVKAASIYGWYTMLVYFMSIPGGWMADRFFGLRNAILYGGIIIAIGHVCLAFHDINIFYAGLGLIIVGTGLLKPNISSIVGSLYSKDDARRDAGFSIFYMGINLGAMVAPLITGYLGQKINWHYGFAAAAVGMTFGVVQYVLGWKHLGNIGMKPTKHETHANLPKVEFTSDEKKRMAAIAVLFVFGTIFWGAFEQAGSSLNLFADQNTRNSIFGWDFPSSYFQSVNSFFIIALAPVFAWIWIKLGKKNPSSPAKFAYGLTFVGLGFLTVAIAASLSGPDKALVSPMWLVLCYLFHTIGELCLSPVALSTVTKLAPARVVGLMMGVWMLSLSFGNKLGGWAAGFFDSMPLPQLFGAVFATTAIAAILMIFMIKPIRNLMSGVH